MQLESMYQEIILDHYRNPHHKGLREPYASQVHHVNPTCGDEVTMRVDLRDGLVGDISYESQGCSISQASASVMADLLIGKSVEQARGVQETFLRLMQAKLEAPDFAEEHEDVLEDAVAFAGVAKYPARVKCALLSWMAWKDATAQALSAGGTGVADAAGGTDEGVKA